MIYREELDLTNNLVLGFVGRLTYHKNLKFIVNIFREVDEINKNSIFLVIGDGEESHVLLNELEKYSLIDKLLRLKSRDDLNQLLNEIDVKQLLPLRSEVLSLVLVDLQTNSLQSVVSNNITKMVNLTPCIPDWIERIRNGGCSSVRIDTKDLLTKIGFHVKIQLCKLMGLYQNLIYNTIN